MPPKARKRWKPCPAGWPLSRRRRPHTYVTADDRRWRPWPSRRGKVFAPCVGRGLFVSAAVLRPGVSDFPQFCFYREVACELSADRHDQGPNAAGSLPIPTDALSPSPGSRRGASRTSPHGWGGPFFLSFLYNFFTGRQRRPQLRRRIRADGSVVEAATGVPRYTAEADGAARHGGGCAPYTEFVALGQRRRERYFDGGYPHRGQGRFGFSSLLIRSAQVAALVPAGASRRQRDHLTPTPCIAGARLSPVMDALPCRCRCL